MAYSDFKTLSKVRATLNLTIDETTRLFPDIAPIAPSDYLKTTLNEFLPLANAINTEKARSELIIAPVLLEVRRHFNFKIVFFSGTDFNVDPTIGLSGYCDYILTASQEMRTVIILCREIIRDRSVSLPQPIIPMPRLPVPESAPVLINEG